MTAEPLLAAPDAGPSLATAGLRIVLALLLLAGAAWVWLSWQRKIRGPARHLEVLDRAFLARGASVAVLRADDRRLLVGVSAEGVRLLRDLGPTSETSPGRFPEVLARAAGTREAEGA